MCKLPVQTKVLAGPTETGQLGVDNDRQQEMNKEQTEIETVTKVMETFTLESSAGKHFLSGGNGQAIQGYEESLTTSSSSGSCDEKVRKIVIQFCLQD
jgi:hypothetical protein